MERNPFEMERKSSRREWLAPVLSHHRAYRSVHGGFNSWRAATDKLWLNHKSHCLSVFLLSLPYLWQLYVLWTNSLGGCILPASPNLSVLPSSLGFAPLSSASSIVSIYTYVFCDRAIHWCHLCSSSCLQFRNSSAILSRTPWFFQGSVWLTVPTYGKIVLSVVT